MIKLPKFILIIVRVVVVPTLTNISNVLKQHAAQTPDEWDDVLVGAFDSVIQFLTDPDVIVPR